MIWKIIPNTSYEISDEGQVRRNGKILKPRLKGNYNQVALSVRGKYTHCSIHTLVAKVFIPNLENLRTVNHKDKDTFNNNVSNLEWASHSNNAKHSYKEGRNTLKRCILQYDMEDNFIREFATVKDANESVGRSATCGAIIRCCQGKLKSSKGFRWEYDVPDSGPNKDDILIELEEFPTYAISENGDVYSVYTKRYLTPSRTKRDQLTVCLRNDNGRKMGLIHRLVAQTFLDNPKGKKYVTHMDGDTSNNSYHNLRWVTPSEYTNLGLKRKIELKQSE